MYQGYYLDMYDMDLGVGWNYYTFDHFDCYGTRSGTVSTCQYYNISSSNTEIKPVSGNGYEIKELLRVYPGTSSERFRVKIPTDTLRNATAGNQIEFYVYGSYNNNPNDNSADGRYAAWSQKMVIDVVCGLERVANSGKS